MKRNQGGLETLLLINQATQDFLIRPMGVFQLLDYVGLDVFQMILKVMRTHLDPAAAGGTVFSDETLDAWLAAGVRGGQLGSGEQKDGLFKYERNRITGVLDPEALAAGKGITYVSLDDAAGSSLDDAPGSSPGAAAVNCPSREDPSLAGPPARPAMLPGARLPRIRSGRRSWGPTWPPWPLRIPAARAWAGNSWTTPARQARPWCARAWPPATRTCPKC